MTGFLGRLAELFRPGSGGPEIPGAAPAAPPPIAPAPVSPARPAVPVAAVGDAARPGPGYGGPELAPAPPLFRVPAGLVRDRGGPEGYRWRLTPAGLVINDLPPVGTPGEPVTIRTTLAWFGPELRAACAEFGVPLELALACAATEATGAIVARRGTRDQARRARREEPGWISDAATPSRVSVGILQTLISTAAEALGRPVTARELENPAVSARAGVAYMARQARATEFDPVRVAAAYNAGSLRVDRARGNPWRLVCYPPGTGEHVSRFVRFYNDAARILRADPGLAGEAPSFAAAEWPAA